MLEAAQLSWLSIVRADGRPHVIPVVSVWRDGALHFSTADIEQKAVKLRGNPRVILTTGCNLWQKGLNPRSLHSPRAASAIPGTSSDCERIAFSLYPMRTASARQPCAPAASAHSSRTASPVPPP